MKAWLSDQPNNTAATPHTIRLNVSDLGGDSFTFGSTGYVLNDSNYKYINLDLSGSTITSIESKAFSNCYYLTSVTFKGTIPSTGFDTNAFGTFGDLRAKFYATDPTNGTPGTYTRPESSSQTWTKQS